MEQSASLKNKPLKLLLLTLFISFLAFLSVRISFGLAQGGDDWGIHWLIWGIFDTWKEATYFNPLSYFCTYCPHYFFLSIISRVFGYEHFYYFLANFIARVVAGLAIFFLLKNITKESFIAILGSIFFVVTYIGIEATDWAFNYNYFLGVGVTAVLFVWYFKAKQTNLFKHILIVGFLVSAAAIIAPARMHGLLPLLLIVEIGWWLTEGKKFSLKMSSLRLLVAFIFYYIVLYGVSDLYIFIRDNFHFEIGPYYIGNGYGAKEWNTQRTLDGINFLKQAFQKGQSDLIIDPIATLGNYVMPDRLWLAIPFSQISLFGRSPFTFFSYLFPISAVCALLTSFILFLAGLKSKMWFLYLGNVIVWMTFIHLLHKANISTFSYPRVAFALVGGFTIIFSIWLFFLLKKSKPLLAHAFILGFGWMFTFILFPWIISPYGIILSWGRYSIQQAAGLAIWMAILAFITIDALSKKRRFIILGITYLVIFLFIFMHIKFSNDYLSYVATYRSKEIDAKFWNKITAEIPTLDKNGLNIFLMITDQESAAIAESIRFGFRRSAIYYNISEKNFTPFMVVNEYEGILSSVYDGKYLLKHGLPPNPTTIDRIYAFALQNKEMINITKQVREKLKEDVKILKEAGPLPPQKIP